MLKYFLHFAQRRDFMAKKRKFTKAIAILLLVVLLLPNLFTVVYATNMEVTAESSKHNYVRKGIVTAIGLNFRSEPSTSSKIISVLPQGATVNIVEEMGNWLEIEYEKTIGYVAKNYVGIILSNGITTASSLIVRSKPTTESQSLGALYQNTRVAILKEIVTNDETNPIWLKIIYTNGNHGYVSAKYVNILTQSDGTYQKIGITTPQLLNVRTGPGLSYEAINLLREGTHVIILDSKIVPKDYYKKWYKINYNGEIGWIAGKFLTEYEWKFATQALTSAPYSSNNRKHNMSLACSTLTGYIVLPGEKFSWVKTMGSCSQSTGYLLAPISTSTGFQDGYGGGVCQVSTTINIAAKSLDISTEAHEHRDRVSYANFEDEASVSYPYLDFAFTNPFDTPILLELVSNNGTVICNIFTAEEVNSFLKKGS